mgnify:CR=1 FL=1
MIKLNKQDFLLVVDPQNDFVTGSLAVKGAKPMLPSIKLYTDMFLKIKQDGKYNIGISFDMHPAVHCSFTQWPPHCVIGTWGAQIVDELASSYLLAMSLPIYKGTNISEDAYSPFQNTGLSDYLRTIEAKRLFVCGIATDYCVKAAVESATKYKHFDGETFVLIDAIAAVNVQLGDGALALNEMAGLGAKLIAMDGFCE